MSHSDSHPDLILASGSRYRRLMLERFGVAFTVVPADIDETPQLTETGEMLARRLASDKAAKVSEMNSEAIVIGCDQVAECDGRLLGKPGNAQNALEQLVFTAGKEVVFHSAMTLRRGRKQDTINVPTFIRMRSLSISTFQRYLERDQPYDCAGSMRSESLGIALTEYIRSDDPSALIGLPMIELAKRLMDYGIDVFSDA